MKKEEIMMKHCSDNGLLNMAMGRSILKAMDEYAEQQVKNLTMHSVINWVAVNESLPEQSEEVLTTTADNWYRVMTFGSVGHNRFPSQVTHWQRIKPPCL